MRYLFVVAVLSLISVWFFYTEVDIETTRINSTKRQVDTVDDMRTLGYPDSRKIVRDPSGNLYLAYRKSFRLNRKTARHIFVAKSPDNGLNWQVLNAAQPIENVGDYVQRVPSIVVDGHGVLHVTWYGLDAESQGDNDRQIKYTNSADGGIHWLPWRNIAPVPGYQNTDLWQEHPVVYAAADEVIYIVWEGKDIEHQRTQVKIVKSIDSGRSWTEWRNVAPMPLWSFSRPTLVAMSKENILYIFSYANFEDVKQIVWIRSADGGDHWSTWEPVAPGEQDQRHLSVEVDGQDTLHLVWRQPPPTGAADGPSQIYYAYFIRGRWSKPELVAPDPDHYQFFPSIAVDSSGKICVAWSSSVIAAGFPTEDPTTGIAYFACKVSGKWQPPQLVAGNETGLYASFRRLQNSGHPTFDLVWMEPLADKAAIFFATFSP